jgi:THO complex subunit 4
MDIDKPLDDIIAANRPKSRSVGPKGTRSRAPPAAAGAGADRKRNDRETRRDAPYARPPPRSTEDKWVHDAYTGPGRGRALRSRDAERETAGVQFVGASPRIEVSGLHYEVTVEELKVSWPDGWGLT